MIELHGQPKNIKQFTATATAADQDGFYFLARQYYAYLQPGLSII
jgi:hypothetical protein